MAEREEVDWGTGEERERERQRQRESRFRTDIALRPRPPILIMFFVRCSHGLHKCRSLVLQL